MGRHRIRSLLVAALSGLALLAVGPGVSVAKAEPPPEAATHVLERTIRRIEADYGLHDYVSCGMVERNPGRCGLSWCDNFGNALLSLTPIKDRKLVFYSRGGSERRGYLSAITTVDGQDTRVFVTHLARAGQTDVRAVQVKELVQATAPYNQALILGDFNADPHGKKLDYVLFRGLASTGFSVIDSEWSGHAQVTGHLRH